MNRLEGKTALVTGGAGGIGQAIGRRFAEQGAKVVLADLNEAAAQAAAAELSALPGCVVRGVQLDVTSEAGWRDAVAAAVAAHGLLDIVVNNAGIAEPPPATFEEADYAQWKRIMTVNLDGAFLGMREAVRAMGKRGGSIVNIGSIAAYVGTPGGAAYGGSKGGVRAASRQVAVACARQGYPIRVNCVHPCYVWTPLVQRSATARFGADGAEEKIRDLHPFRCLAEPDDVAYAALYLASDEARLVNGADLIVDGAALAV